MTALSQHKAPELEISAFADASQLSSNINPLLDQLEKTRIKNLKRHSWRVRIGMVLGIAAVFGAYKIGLEGSDRIMALQLLVGTFFFTVLWAWAPLADYRRAYKRDLMPKIMASFGNFTYKADGRINTKKLDKSGIFRRDLAYNAEDHAYGRYQDAMVEFSEAKLLDRTRKDPATGRKPQTVFDGMFLLLQFAQPFEGHTFITARRGTLNDKAHATRKKLEAMTLADPTMNAMFDVYSTHLAEAGKLANASIMGHITKLANLYDHAVLEVAIYGPYVFITIPCDTDLFEPAAITKPAFSIDDLPLLQNTMKEVLGLVDNLRGLQGAAAINASQTAGKGQPSAPAGTPAKRAAPASQPAAGQPSAAAQPVPQSQAAPNAPARAEGVTVPTAPLHNPS